MVGYYCPEGSYVPLPCNVGTYNEYEYGMSDADCLNCPVDHFNHLEGQDACFHCGAEAYQTEMGQPQCQCAGAGKQFQVNYQTSPNYSSINDTGHYCIK